jgi:hypothetical protein
MSSVYSNKRIHIYEYMSVDIYMKIYSYIHMMIVTLTDKMTQKYVRKAYSLYAHTESRYVDRYE